MCVCEDPTVPTRPLTLLFDLADLTHSLAEDGAFVRFDVEAVDVAEVGGDQLCQLLDVLALLLPSLPLASAVGGGEKTKKQANWDHDDDAEESGRANW